MSSSYWSRVIGALMGKSGESGRSADSAVRSLQLDLEDRDRRIEQMRAEYALLKADRDRAIAGAGHEHMSRVFKKAAGTLSNLAALTALHDAGHQVAAADFAALARSLDKELAKAGLERIGTSGESIAFDVALHQRMSGGSVRAGTVVTVRVPGYRMGEQVLIKAMVSGREDHSA